MVRKYKYKLGQQPPSKMKDVTPPLLKIMENPNMAYMTDNAEAASEWNVMYGTAAGSPTIRSKEEVGEAIKNLNGFVVSPSFEILFVGGIHVSESRFKTNTGQVAIKTTGWKPWGESLSMRDAIMNMSGFNNNLIKDAAKVCDALIIQNFTNLSDVQTFRIFDDKRVYSPDEYVVDYLKKLPQGAEKPSLVGIVHAHFLEVTSSINKNTKQEQWRMKLKLESGIAIHEHLIPGCITHDKFVGQLTKNCAKGAVVNIAPTPMPSDDDEMKMVSDSDDAAMGELLDEYERGGGSSRGGSKRKRTEQKGKRRQNGKRSEVRKKPSSRSSSKSRKSGGKRKKRDSSSESESESQSETDSEISEHEKMEKKERGAKKPAKRVTKKAKTNHPSPPPAADPPKENGDIVEEANDDGGIGADDIESPRAVEMEVEDGEGEGGEAMVDRKKGEEEDDDGNETDVVDPTENEGTGDATDYEEGEGNGTEG